MEERKGDLYSNEPHSVQKGTKYENENASKKYENENALLQSSDTYANEPIVIQNETKELYPLLKDKDYVSKLLAPEEIEIEKYIGGGAFGSVWKGTLKKNQVVAIKLQPASKNTSSEKEYSLMKGITHKNVVSLINWIPSCSALVFEVIFFLKKKFLVSTSHLICCLIKINNI